jgi:hypothetical protein
MPFLLSYTSPTNKKTFLGLKSFMDVLLLWTLDYVLWIMSHYFALTYLCISNCFSNLVSPRQLEFILPEGKDISYAYIFSKNESVNNK